MPRKPKLRFSHTQARGQEVFFKDRKGRINEMIGFDAMGYGKYGAGYKSKRGTWGILRPLKLWRKK